MLILIPFSLTGSTSSLTEVKSEPQDVGYETAKIEPGNVSSTCVKCEPDPMSSDAASDSGISSFVGTTARGSTENVSLSSVKEEMNLSPPEGDMPFMHHVLHLRGMGHHFQASRGWGPPFRGKWFFRVLMSVVVVPFLGSVCTFGER